VTQIIDINTRRNNTDCSNDPPEPSSDQSQDVLIENMMLTLEKQYNTLKAMREAGVEHLDVTIAEKSSFEFTPKSLCVILGNGETVICSGLSSLTAIEALGLNAKLNEIILGE